MFGSAKNSIILKQLKKNIELFFTSQSHIEKIEQAVNPQYFNSGGENQGKN